MHGKYALFLALLVLLLGIAAYAMSSPASAATVCVDPGNVLCFPTIQAGIDAALPGDTVTIASGTYNENVRVSKNITLQGPANINNPATINGGAAGPAVEITTTYTVAIVGLVIQNGQAPRGGGILNQGYLTVISSTIQNNTATSQGQGGGGIYNSRSVTVTSSSIISNTAYSNPPGGLSQGGGIYSTQGGRVAIFNSTISNNSADADGGGIFSTNYATATVYLNNATITLNRANVNTLNNGINTNDGGGVNVVSGTVHLKNTILAGNLDVAGIHPAGVDCSLHAGILTSDGYNLVGVGGDAKQCIFIPNLGDQVNTNASTPLNPMLGPLGKNGGPTLTHALLNGSTAIGAGFGTDSFGHPVTVDQRGVTRPQGNRYDIGAFESNINYLYFYLPFIHK